MTTSSVTSSVEAIRCLVYSSSATHEFSAEELERLLVRTRARNQVNHVSGILLYREGCFFQVLEGPSAAVEQTFNRIQRDPRHHSVMRLLDQQVTERSFPEWSMAFRKLSKELVDPVPGFSEFLRTSGDPGELAGVDARVRKLLLNFRSLFR
jgi:hypothetical protein